MRVMKDDPKSRDGQARSRDHLTLVPAIETLEAAVAHAGRPRTIGRLIAQTALIAESTVQRRRDRADEASHGGRRLGERLLGRFR